MTELLRLTAALADRYAIEREIGAGGMATVYLARDVRHDRRVAVKVLSRELGAVLGGERFLAEIKVTATLQHPNLLPLFDSGEADGLLFYVMPFVEGESLRHRLEREKQLAVDDALQIALAMCGALDYAHRQGVIHRDLKPENILLHEGQPLIADFGIALAVSNAGGARITQTGISLGTPQYMSPEQATGDRVIDGRADIYSLAAVLYEMLAGDPPYLGGTAQAVIAKVLTERPRSVRLARPTVPEHVSTAIERALEKLPADRFATAHEMAEALRGRVATASARVEDASGRPIAARPRADARVRSVLAGALIVAVALGAWGWIRPRPVPGAAPSARFVVTLPPDIAIDNVYAPLAISHDGRTIVFRGTASGTTQLMRRRIDELEAKPIAHSDAAGFPSVSTDNKWVAYAADDQLRRVPIDGGPSVLVAIAGGVGGSGIDWTPSGILVLGENLATKGLSTVPASGGKLTSLTTIDTARAEAAHRWPCVLADGQTVVFVVWPKEGITGARLAVTTLAGGATRVLDVVGTRPLGVALGHLIYVSVDGVLSAVPFDVRSRTVTGPPVSLVEGIDINRTVGAARAALSDSGTLVYLSSSTRRQMVTSTLSGVVERTIAQAGTFASPAWSPDGRRIAVRMTTTQGSDVWVFDLASSAFTRLTTDGHSDFPSWAPDGKSLIVVSTRNGRSAVWRQAADAGGIAEKLFDASAGDVIEALLAPDGHTLVTRNQPNNDLAAIDLAGDKKPRRLLSDDLSRVHPALSPNGKWLAFAVEAGGASQVVVNPFPAMGGGIQISTDGGTEPVWSPDGTQLYYRHGRQIVAVSLGLGTTITVTGRRVLADGLPFAEGFGAPHQSFSVSPDGKHFVWLKSVDEEARLVVTTNWFAALRAAIAAKR